MTTTVTSTISQRTTTYAAMGLLYRAQPEIIIEQFAQPKPLPKNKGLNIKFRRYYISGQTGAAGPDTGVYSQSLPTTPLTEGVTPTARALAYKDYSATLAQYGDLMEFTDVIEDTHEDPVLNEAINIHGETIAQMRETLNYNVLKAGAQVVYANGSARNAVNTPITLTLQRKATNLLRRQNAKHIRDVIRSTTSYGTKSVEPCYVAIGHVDIENDVRGLSGFKIPGDYGMVSGLFQGEFGSVESVRYCVSTNMAPFADAGGATSTMNSTTGTNADVYPIIVMGANAWATVPLQGMESVDVSVLPANQKTKSDPLGQISKVGFKMWHTALILMEQHIVRMEVAVTKL